jgi:long-chain acyl-CoA synthetase
MLTHQNYLEQIQSLSQCFAFQEQDRYFSILPTNHAIDFMCGFIAPLLFGATIVHQRTLRPQFLLSTMRKYQITLMALVPRILKAFEENIREELEKLPLWQQPLFEGLKEINHWATQRTPRLPLSRLLLKPLHDKFGGKLRLLFCGGAFVEKKCAEFFYQLGFPVVIGYGMTEACTVITLNDLQPFRANSVGRPLPQNLLKIQEANDEGIGEVWVKSPTVMKAYFKEPEQTQEVLKDGWLKTGDLGFIDASGHLKLLGRSKNIIVTSGGKNVYPEDLEASFQDLKGYEEYCILATHFIWGHSLQSESLTLIVRPQESSFSSEKFQQELLQKNLQLVEFKRLSYFLVWHSPFPRTASLKIKRELLAKEISSSPQSALVAL